jgi:4,5-DOPA dioxygenase extradiol
MNRKKFIQSMLALGAIGGLSSVKGILSNFTEEDYTYPTLFIGHGSPMNGIENNSFTEGWKSQLKDLPTPKLVLVVSAHWLTNGTKVTAMEFPETIHDFGGFPQELFDVNYPAPGSPEFAKTIKDAVSKTTLELDHEWGLDHGTWTIIRHIYPDAKVPVIQLSIDASKPAQYHYELAQQLAQFRKKGVLIIGSGNMVHNLRLVTWDKLNTPNFGFDWAIEAQETFNKLILEGNHKALIEYEKLGKAVQLAAPGIDHYFPLIYTLGLAQKDEQASLFNNELVGGSLNMTSVKFGA